MLVEMSSHLRKSDSERGAEGRETGAAESVNSRIGRLHGCGSPIVIAPAQALAPTRVGR